MDHGASGLALEHLAGDQGGDQVGADRFAEFVDEGGAITVAVEADAQVRLLLDDQRAQVAQVRRQQRIRLVVREAAVELEVERQQLHAAGLEQGPVDRAHAVGGVGGEPQLRGIARLEGAVKEGEDVFGVLRLDAPRLDPAGDCGRRRLFAQSMPLDDRDAVIAGHRHRAGEAELEAVVLGGVVAGRDLNAAGRAEVAGGEVVHRRRGEADVENVEPGRGEPRAQCRGQRHAVVAHVSADDDGAGQGRALVALERDQALERHADPPRQLLVQLPRVEAAHVVRLEDPCHVAPLAPCSAAPAQWGCTSIARAKARPSIGASSRPSGPSPFTGCRVTASVPPRIQSRCVSMAASTSSAAR